MACIGVLTGAVALLCLAKIVSSIVKRKLSKKEGGRFSGLKVFFVLGFLQVTFLTVSSFRSGSPVLTHLLAFIRSPLLSSELFFDNLTELGELPFVTDLFTAIIFGSSVAITLSDDLDINGVAPVVCEKKRGKAAQFSLKDAALHEVSSSYLTFCRYLS